MQIDARKLDVQDLLVQLKEALSSMRGCGVDIEILLKSTDHSKKITSFVSMSGCSTKIDKKNNYYIMHVKGNICCA